jgi:hypothetical protein
MARAKILLTTMFVLTLFMMCCGCESEHHERRSDQNGWNRGEGDKGWDRDLDRDKQRESESRQQEHGERK